MRGWLCHLVCVDTVGIVAGEARLPSILIFSCEGSFGRVLIRGFDCQERMRMKSETRSEGQGRYNGKR